MSDLWPGIDPRLQAFEDAGNGYEITMAKAWTGERLALLGYMLGLGCTVEEIAARLNLTVNQIHRQANRMHTVFAGVARNK